MKLSLALLFGSFSITSILKAASIEVTISNQAGEAWSEKENTLIKQASQIVFDRIAETRIAKCAYRNSFREDSDKLRKKWGDSIPKLNKRRKVTLRIRKERFDKTILGKAEVGIARIDHQKYEFHNLDIILSEKDLNQDVQNYSNSAGSNATLDRWINTIAHELAHNFGFTHGSQYRSWPENYAGFFATELGFCVMTDGRYGSDLGDRKLRQQRIRDLKRIPKFP